MLGDVTGYGGMWVLYYNQTKINSQLSFQCYYISNVYYSVHMFHCISGKINYYYFYYTCIMLGDVAEMWVLYNQN